MSMNDPLLPIPPPDVYLRELSRRLSELLLQTSQRLYTIEQTEAVEAAVIQGPAGPQGDPGPPLDALAEIPIWWTEDLRLQFILSENP